MRESYATTTTSFDSLTKCAKCHATFICYGVVMEWTWINDEGPYCEKCMRDGVTYRHPEYVTAAMKKGTITQLNEVQHGCQTVSRMRPRNRSRRVQCDGEHA